MPYDLAYRSQTPVASRQWGNSHLGLIDETWRLRITFMDEMSTPPKECLRPPPAQLYIIMYISTEGTTDNDDIVPLLATHKQATMEHEKVCIQYVCERSRTQSVWEPHVTMLCWSGN